MLRTSLLYFAGVFLAISILVVSLFAATFRSVRAAPIKATPSASSVVSPTPSAVNYTMPYPGVLPDSPLWFLKAARDRVLLWLTFDSLAKSERLLLYADKRIEAAKVLVEGGKPTLGVTTAIKGEKYLYEAASELVTAKKNGQNIEILGAKIKTSIAAHREIIESLQKRSPDLFAALKETLSLNQSTSLLLP